MKALFQVQSSTGKARIALLIPLLAFLALPMASCGSDEVTGDVIQTDTPTDDVHINDVNGEVPGDVIPEDTGRDIMSLDVQADGIEPGQFGAPCDDYDDCESKLCIEAEGGSVCTKLCLQQGCPDGYICSGIVNTYPDTIFLCMPVFSKVCTACTTDNQCAGGKCMQFPEGSFCTVPCDKDPCPTGYDCKDIVNDNDGDADLYCVPPSGSCLCRAKDEGTKRACEKTNEVGTCFGYESCDPEIGFTACDAATAKAEECNGLDDDCNGSPDDNITEGGDCTIENDKGICHGTAVCMGLKGWGCNGQTPADEACDGIDNDCDGDTDEDFKVDGIYGTTENCGACNKSCDGLFPNATVDCDTTGAVPRCVVVDCNDGFYKLNDYQCVPLTSTICNTCVLDTDCIVAGARCVTFEDGGKYCGQPCVDSGECPTGYSCLPVEGGTNQCLPDSGTCACTSPDPNITRVCKVSWQETPESPFYTCTGVQRCGVGGWSDCELPDEECNGLDDNCDGTIDEGFTEEGTGRYITDTNCGVCANNCTTMTVPNGHGVCDTARTIPDCMVACNEGFQNVDGNPANGCECHFTSSTDLPGGGDADCDGIDGQTDGAFFVAKWGADTNPGTIEQPVLTIARAYALAELAPSKDIYVATGIYTEPVSVRSGISIYGGFSADFKILNPVAYETVILGQEPAPMLPGAVNAVSIKGGAAGSTVFSGFVVIAYNNRTSGQNSIGMYVKDCDATLAIQNSRVVGGLAGNGAPGSLGISGSDGVSGAAGAAAYDVGKSNCGNSSNSGGTGGAFTCNGTPVDGGKGGNSICPDYDEDTNGCPTNDPDANPPEVLTQTRTSVENGGTGSNGGGAGGQAGLDAYIGYTCTGRCSCYLPGASMTGAAGAIGPDGTNGNGGGGCTASAGTVVDGLWVPATATGGGTGANGGGGGGGGAGGSVETITSLFCDLTDTSDLGGSGGGGGSGGCGATGGTAGASGGGSFAIFVVYTSTPTSVPSITATTVTPGQGGIGGNGGPAGVGGQGGAGALGGGDGAGNGKTFCAPGGGAGGNGGAGGHGGGGGGGCGGPAYGIFASGVSSGLINGWKTSVVFSGAGEGGAGGTGGTSFGADGSDGSDGVAANTNF